MKGKIFNLRFVLAVIFLVDQMLLPMFHLGPIPFKPSYLILLTFLAVSPRYENRLHVFFRSLFLPIVGLTMTTIIGGVIFYLLNGVPDSDETFKSILVYLMCLGAMKLGMLNQMPGKYILLTLYCVSALIVILVFFPSYFPTVTNLWWNSQEIIKERMHQNLMRPTPFGDGSGTRVNILFLGVCLLNIYDKVKTAQKVLIILVVFLINLTLGSRNQIVAFVLITIVFVSGDLKLYRKTPQLVFYSFLIALIIPLVFSVLTEVKVLEHTIERVSMLNEIFDTEEKNQTSNVLRPLLMLEKFAERFSYSPLVGSGFGIKSVSPFDYMHYHNDWLLILASSGLIGFIFFLNIIVKIWKFLGWIVIYPFFLPGLTNSFISDIPSYLTFFFLVGAVASRKVDMEAVSSSELEWNDRCNIKYINK